MGNNLLKIWTSIPIGADTDLTAENSRYDPDNLPGSCRWDYERSNILGNDQACMCPATEKTCEREKGKCWWYKLPDDMDGLLPSFACLNNAERFYYLLQKLLKKRGKNDFAIKINYGSSPQLANPLKDMDGGLLQKFMMFRIMTQLMQRNSGGGSSYNSNYNQGYNSNNGYGYGSNYNNYSQSNNNPYNNYNSYYPAASAGSYYNQQYNGYP